jgi:spore coat polysaccharide biosynthesis protein SpsF
MLCIIQSRMSSSRLPGKMMLDIYGRKLLGRVIDRVRLAKLVSKIIVATSIDPSDDPIKKFCDDEAVICYRGSLENVALRFKDIVQFENAESFIRINGDSPLIDPVLIDSAISYFQFSDCDLVTNVGIRTFPKGQSVEVILTKTYIKAYENSTTKEQREHVTKIYYENFDKFRIINFTSGGNFKSINLCIDTLEDKIQIENILKQTENVQIGWKDLLLIMTK